MPHAENLLALLDSVRCQDCGRPAVRGATLCMDCVKHDPDQELQAG